MDTQDPKSNDSLPVGSGGSEGATFGEELGVTHPIVEETRGISMNVILTEISRKNVVTL